MESFGVSTTHPLDGTQTAKEPLLFLKLPESQPSYHTLDEVLILFVRIDIMLVGGTCVSNRVALITAQIAADTGRGAFSTSWPIFVHEIVQQQGLWRRGKSLVMISINVGFYKHPSCKLTEYHIAEVQGGILAIFGSSVAAMEHPQSQPIQEGINTANKIGSQKSGIKAYARLIDIYIMDHNEKFS
ncbi:uncharacterized protein VDAG_07194 [Verticillium dahliae VdLs.17]|uniref:Uncharacterized protein n=1 Tax=Verticillium dahliae (strain VdLs.17 / ATCC MYA-4575 / FGSC 10137) TaxID=498257 RepID=G2XB56_VERDV|nr:uncharacterized protein VDAG_07194 [Verticillium dahliae VdLs.17]EGY16030.1 hypothetical protein VDAG_07194 [Verticillium dahliae VdLs.17]KAH6686987.1 hypothetical protein EV126DRAFT_349990 [Verticillium dahliae]